MVKVTVYRFENYDIRMDEIQRSNRYATKQWIARWGFEAVEATAVEVPREDLDADGLAPRGYNPHSRIRHGFPSSL